MAATECVTFAPPTEKVNPCRHYCFTSYDDVLSIDESKVKYCIYQPEICPTTGKHHYQGYIEFVKPQRYKGAEKILGGSKCRFFPRKGTREQARDYCLKGESRKPDTTYTEIGNFEIKQGSRVDLSKVYSLIADKKPLAEIFKECPMEFMKYHSGIKEAKAIVDREASKRFRHVKVIILRGDAGIGKTRYVYDTYGYDDVYKLDCSNNVWFDGYEGQKVLLLDDYYGWLKWGHFLNILDGYPMRLDVKCSFTYAQWETIYITSNKPARQWYSRGMPPELRRRINKVIKITAEGHTEISIDDDVDESGSSNFNLVPPFDFNNIYSSE